MASSSDDVEMAELPPPGDSEVAELSPEKEDVEAQKKGSGADGEGAEDEEPISLVTKGVLAACGAMILFWLIGFILKSSNAAVVVAAIISVVVGAIVAKVQYFDIEDTDSLRQVQNVLRSKVNAFSLQNDRLEDNNTRLEGELVPLKECEESLAKLAEENGSDVATLTQLVKENQAVLNEMQETQKQDVVQSMMECLFNVDRDEDGKLSTREINRLRRALMNLPTIEINQDLFEGKLARQKSVGTFIGMIHEVADDNIPDEQRVFKLSENSKEEEVDKEANF
jgi:hypothetical protein